MARQRVLPGIPPRPTVADIKALVKSRLLGFELRRKLGKQRRARAPAAVQAQPCQQELFVPPPTAEEP